MRMFETDTELEGHWLRTIAVISLDIGSIFADDLGLRSMLSPELRDIARRHSDPSRGSMINCRPGAMVASFVDLVSRQLGTQAIIGVERWKTLAYPQRTLSSQFWIWSVLLESLRQSWDACDRAAIGLPMGHEVAGYRVRVRDYLEHMRNVRTELESSVTYDLSDWDKRFQSANATWFDIVTRLHQVVQALSAGELWLAMLRGLPEKEIELLGQWALAEAQDNDMPLAEAALPLAAAVECYEAMRG